MMSITHSSSLIRPSINSRSYPLNDASKATPSNKSCRVSPTMSSICIRRTPISSPCRRRPDRLFSGERCYPSLRRSASRAMFFESAARSLHHAELVSVGRKRPVLADDRSSRSTNAIVTQLVNKIVVVLLLRPINERNLSGASRQ